MAFSTVSWQDDEAKWKCKCTLGYEGDPKIPGLEKGSIEGVNTMTLDNMFLRAVLSNLV